MSTSCRNGITKLGASKNLVQETNPSKSTCFSYTRFPDATQHRPYTDLETICAKSDFMKEQSEVIASPWSSQAEVGTASVNVIKMLYGGKENDTLTRLRYVVLIILGQIKKNSYNTEQMLL